MGEGWQKQNIMEVPKRRVISHNRETPVDEMGKQTEQQKIARKRRPAKAEKNRTSRMGQQN